MAFLAKLLFCSVLVISFQHLVSASGLDFDPHAFYKLRARSNGVFTPTVRRELITDLASNSFSHITSFPCSQLLLTEISDTVAFRSPTQVTGENGNGTTIYFDPVEDGYFQQVLPLVFLPRRFGEMAFKPTEGLSTADETSRARKRFLFEAFRYVTACFAAGLDPDPAVVETGVGRKIMAMLWTRMNSQVPGVRENSVIDVAQDLRIAIQQWQQGTMSDVLFLDAAFADHGFQWSFELPALLKFSNTVELAVATGNYTRVRYLSEYVAAVINRNLNLQSPLSRGSIAMAHRRLFPSE